ncbi:hypothetical protein PsorP6_013740 [Peronosclerospora sorghi]|uniref:Uncharacterized protein n=1 Tax=Peronosclerospora sorghi TaxID=230839 RepID=A0ACC0VJP6_9STRA|nr:hypothetical protein PsorP6_013740 [Peronosclerospora sorghi]
MEEVVRELQSDAQLSVFLSPECDVSAIASAVVGRDSSLRDVCDSPRGRTSSVRTSTDNLNETSESERFVKRLDDAVHRIDHVIAEHVGDHHASLLDQVGSVDELQSHVMSVKSSVGKLNQSVHSLETLVRKQHENLRHTILRYRNIQQCGDIVRRVLRFQQLFDRVIGSKLNQIDATSTESAKNGSSGLIGDARKNELVSVALAIKEMEMLVQDKKFMDLSVVRTRLPASRKLCANLKLEVRSSLRSGIQSLSQADIGDALQILFCLGDLATTAQASVNDVIQEVEHKCSATISEEKFVRSDGVRPSDLNSSKALSSDILEKSDLWKAIQDVFDIIRIHALQVWNLQHVLHKMVDPISSKKYIDLVLEPDEPSLFATFWEVVSAILREIFQSTLSYNKAVKSMLIADYPRMREQAIRVLNELNVATKQSAGVDFLTDSSSFVKCSAVERKVEPIAGSTIEQTQLLDTIAPLHDAFLDRAFRRMSKPVQLMFPHSPNFHASPPGRSDMQTLSRTFFAELEQAGRDFVLLDGIFQQIKKSVDLFCSNVKKIMHKGKAATVTMPSYGRSPAQAHNVELLNALNLLDGAVEELKGRLEATAVTNSSQAKITASMASSSNVIADGVITPKQAKALSTKYLASCSEMIGDLEYAILGYYLQVLAVLLESIVAKMHDESFGDQGAAATATTFDDAPRNSGGSRSSEGTCGSKYMHEFVSAFTVILEEHLRHLPVASFVTKCLTDFVERLISVFIRHASMLRPLSENGKLRLANDMTEFELLLEHVMPLRNVGPSYEELRAFRHMIFLKSGEILRDATVDKIRPSNLWHHLTSRAPPELQLPHQMKHWTASKYIDWLDTCAAREQSSTSPPSSSSKASTLSPSLRDLPLGYPYLKDARQGLQAEKQAWKEIRKCLDTYSERVSASLNAELSPIYDLLQESSAILLAGYEVMVSRR